jgi:glycosyltransferase involved in cell wall biosynthesis
MAAAAVMSVLGQEEKDFELLVVDDGSTDDTQQVLGRLPKDPRIRCTRRDKNQGQHACRNHAIRQAKGEFITFLDSDDLYLPKRLKAFKESAAERPAAGFWFSNAYVLRFGVVISRVFDPMRSIPEGKVPGHYAVGDKHLPYLTTNVAIRREAFDRFGLFREDLRILEDTELYARMLAGGLEVGVIREALSVRCLHESQITRDYERDYQEALLALDAGKPPEEVRAARRRELALEVAGYLWKDLQPEKARAFLLKELGEAARKEALYAKTFVPVSVLRTLKQLRELRLRIRYSPLLAPPEYRRALNAIRPYKDFAERL